MAAIDKYFQILKEKGGSDLHFLANHPAKIRVHGRLEPISKPISDAQLQKLLREICSEQQWRRWQETGDLDFAYQVPGVARFRSNYLKHHWGIGAVFRIIPTKIKALEELGVPLVLKKFAYMRSGLILVTGPTGSGKSTTLAAIIDFINSNFRRHIITIEDPIEFVHPNKNSVITQREIGHDTESFAAALRSAAREDPDIILVGEMRDLETISLAITLAEMGQVVFGTLHTNSAAKTIDRIIDVFPEDQQAQIRTMLSVSLKGVVSQLLLRTKDGQGRVAVNEILFGSSSLANIIREGAIGKIISTIEAGRGEGMQTMDDSIKEKLEAGIISAEDAYFRAFDKSKFEKYLRKEGKADLIM
ncbi:MAG: type IV pilus twitching motility protein PilT [Planctomycetota bacterium]|nr:MAG: type IV pilus twitching motility protein PilT [Planctomycetota bacterium]